MVFCFVGGFLVTNTIIVYKGRKKYINPTYLHSSIIKINEANLQVISNEYGVWLT